MHRTPVTSTNIRSIGYDGQTATLEVEFVSGNIKQKGPPVKEPLSPRVSDHTIKV